MSRGRGRAALLLGILALLGLPAVAALDVPVAWTAEQAPTVVTFAPLNVTAEGARLRGELVSLGGASAVDVRFQWGPTPALGAETPAQTLTEPGPFEAVVEGLEADRDYYFRSVASGEGVAYGATETFRTEPAPSVLQPFPSLWLILALIASAVVVSLFLLRERLPLPLGPSTRRDEEPSPAQEGGEVEATLAGLEAVRSGRVPPERKESLTATLLQTVAAASREDGDAAPTPRRLDPAEVRRRQAIFEKRVKEADRRLEADGQDQDALFAKATYLALRKGYSEAIDLLNALTHLNPRYPGVWYLKAKIYELMGDMRMAELCLMSASRIA